MRDLLCVGVDAGEANRLAGKRIGRDRSSAGLHGKKCRQVGIRVSRAAAHICLQQLLHLALDELRLGPEGHLGLAPLRIDPVEIGAEQGGLIVTGRKQCACAGKGGNIGLERGKGLRQCFQLGVEKDCEIVPRALDQHAGKGCELGDFAKRPL